MRRPDSTAEIGAGAEGWASGSQAWKGTRAAFRPKPRRKKAAAMPTTGLGVELLEGLRPRRRSRGCRSCRRGRRCAARMKAEADDREHQVLEGGLELVVPEPEGDQGVGGDGGDLEEEVDAEQVGRPGRGRSCPAIMTRNRA